jgi:L-fucose mutarotase
MLKSQLLHPQILAALAKSGHGSKVLISDGNYPHWTKHGPGADVVYLNLAPGQMLVTDVLKALVTAIAVEKAEVMDYARTGPNSLSQDPPIWNEFRQLLHDGGADLELEKVERFAFYDAAGTKDVCLTVATGDQRIYANLMLTVGVVKPKS